MWTDASSDGFPDAEETILYTITVKNAGTVTLEGVEVVGTSGAVSCINNPQPVAVLAVGDSYDCETYHQVWAASQRNFCTESNVSCLSRKYEVASEAICFLAIVTFTYLSALFSRLMTRVEMFGVKRGLFINDALSIVIFSGYLTSPLLQLYNGVCSAFDRRCDTERQEGRLPLPVRASQQITCAFLIGYRCRLVANISSPPPACLHCICVRAVERTTGRVVAHPSRGQRWECVQHCHGNSYSSDRR